MENFFHQVEELGLNLYNAAVITDEGLQSCRFQPSSNCHNGYSVAKAFIVTAAGLLYDDGLLKPEDRLADFLPVPETAHPNWRKVTVHHLLTHTSGTDEGFLDIDVEDVRQWHTEDYLDRLFLQPLPHEPGTHEQYSDGVFYALSRIISAAAGETADMLLQRRILTPMQFGETAWSRCPKGHPIGATGMYAEARDVVKLGWLYLNGGVWQGQQLLSRKWTEMVLQRGYELTPRENGWFAKGGMYGQIVALHPQLRAAIAWYGFDNEMPAQEILDLLSSHLQGRNRA